MESRGNALSRRQFAGIMAAGAVAAMVGLPSCSPKDASNAKVEKKYDYDVVVLGGGGAGTSAAGKAAEAGAKTVLLEKMGWLAGSSSMCLGGFYGAGNAVQKRAGLEDDTPEALLEYFLASNGDKLDYDVQEFCAYHFGETIDWLSEELGVPFQDEVLLKGKDTVKRQSRCKNNGMDALSAVYRFAQDQGAEFMFNMAAEKLIVDDSGAVCGVLARESNGRLSQFNAKSVVVATGGFCRNAEMIAEYMPDFKQVPTEVGLGCTGEGLQMGLDLGADYIGHGGVNGILWCPAATGQSKLIDKKAMWVDASGKRFVNEAGQTHDIFYQVAQFDGAKFYAVYDQAMVDALKGLPASDFKIGLEKGLFAKGDTVAEAAKPFGIDGAALQASLDEYNTMCETGADTAFHKKAANMIALTEPPYYVLTMSVSSHGSFGGYRVNTEFQVLDTAGNPIPNLYSAGEVCSGTFIYDEYPAGGCGLNWAYTSGRFAGANAAQAVLA